MTAMVAVWIVIAIVLVIALAVAVVALVQRQRRSGGVVAVRPANDAKGPTP
jgi:hypothetical protein